MKSEMDSSWQNNLFESLNMPERRNYSIRNLNGGSMSNPSACFFPLNYLYYNEGSHERPGSYLDEGTTKNKNREPTGVVSF